MFWVVCQKTKDAKVKKLTCSSSFLTLCEQARPGSARAHHPRCPAAARDPLPKTRLKVRATDHLTFQVPSFLPTRLVLTAVISSLWFRPSPVYMDLRLLCYFTTSLCWRYV